jgi:hypothetical protein
MNKLRLYGPALVAAFASVSTTLGLDLVAIAIAAMSVAVAVHLRENRIVRGQCGRKAPL